MIKWRRLEVSSGFLLAVAVLLWLGSGTLLFWAALACILHELGHMAALRAMGGKIRALRITVVGAELVFSSRQVLSYGRELIVVLAGPACNLAAALLTARLLGAREGTHLFVGLNLVLGCFQLLPIYPLDGGRALEAMIALFFLPAAAQRFTRALSLVCELILLALGAAVLWHTGCNFTLLVTALWLLAGTLGRRYPSFSSASSSSRSC
ncbi:MAG: peptidase M50 [Clostridiales bacterium]|nr:peptidase M50 [Clostridiales bacterium]